MFSYRLSFASRDPLRQVAHCINELSDLPTPIGSEVVQEVSDSRARTLSGSHSGVTGAELGLRLVFSLTWIALRVK